MPLLGGRKDRQLKKIVITVLTVLAFFVSILDRDRDVKENIYKPSTYLFKEIDGKPLDLGSDQKFCKAFVDPNVKMDIHFTVTAKGLAERYTNIFQTDDLNKGLRIEINPTGILAVHVQKSFELGNYGSVVANEIIKAKTLTRINISVYLNTLTVQINDGLIASNNVADLRPTCDRVLIGGGYDSTRTTLGKVRAKVRIYTLESVTTFGLPMRTRGIARILFIVFTVGFAWQYRKKLFVFNDDRLNG